jgi:predicted deacetylase
MPPTEEIPRALCVSVHDVAPHTWPQCERLLQAIRAVADIPVTLLVVPAYHHRPVTVAAVYERALEQCMAAGDELALHGYTHLDEGPAPARWRDKFTRQIYTLREGEFSALGVAEARERLNRGLAWFQCRKWPVWGFVAPAWLLSDGAWQALADFPFTYTTTLTRFYSLPERRALLSPTLVYSARNRWGRILSRQANAAWSGLMQGAPLVRLGLHPNDARDPRTMRHFQRLLEKLLATRTAMTKASFADSHRDWINRQKAALPSGRAA